MKLVRTIVRANKVEDVREALGKLHGADMTVTEVRRPGHQKDQADLHARRGYAAPGPSNALIELVVPDEILGDVIQTITRAARLDEIGDGHISVLPLDLEEQLRAGERDVV